MSGVLTWPVSLTSGYAGLAEGAIPRKGSTLSRLRATSTRLCRSQRCAVPRRRFRGQRSGELGTPVDSALPATVGRCQLRKPRCSISSLSVCCGTGLRWARSCCSQVLASPAKRELLTAKRSLVPSKKVGGSYWRTEAGEVTGDKRFRCPVCAHRCHHPAAKTPSSYKGPMVARPGTTRCCGGVVTIKVEYLDFLPDRPVRHTCMANGVWETQPRRDSQ